MRRSRSSPLSMKTVWVTTKAMMPFSTIEAQVKEDEKKKDKSSAHSQE